MTQRSTQETFTDRFRSLRRMDETQIQFAHRLDISRPTVAQYENGLRVPDARMLKQICEKCSVTADWLLGLSEVRTPSSDIQTACRTLYASEKAIENIIEINKPYVEEEGRNVGIFSDFLEMNPVYWFGVMKYFNIYTQLRSANPRYDSAENDFNESALFEYEHPGQVVLSRSEAIEYYAKKCSDAFTEMINRETESFIWKGEENDGKH